MALLPAVLLLLLLVRHSSGEKAQRQATDFNAHAASGRALRHLLSPTSAATARPEHTAHAFTACFIVQFLKLSAAGWLSRLLLLLLPAAPTLP